MENQPTISSLARTKMPHCDHAAGPLQRSRRSATFAGTRLPGSPVRWQPSAPAGILSLRVQVRATKLTSRTRTDSPSVRLRKESWGVQDDYDVLGRWTSPDKGRDDLRGRVDTVDD
jgi:hypothetical protein